MKQIVRNTALSAIRLAGSLQIPRLLHRMWFSDKLTIVMYHAVIRKPLERDNWCFLAEEKFREQISYLKTHFEVLPLVEAVDRMCRRELTRPTAAITFDDGFQNNYDIAFPILREAGLPATVFLTTSLIGTDTTFWYLKINEAAVQTKKTAIEWDGSTYPLTTPDVRARSGAALCTKLKFLPTTRRMNDVQTILQILGFDADAPVAADSPFRMLSAQAVREMAASPVMEFGAHTHNHPVLSTLSLDECRDEIAQSTAVVRDLTGRPCETFAYPFGRGNDYNADTVKVLEECGIRAAVTSSAGFNDIRVPPLELNRCGVGSRVDMGFFQYKIHLESIACGLRSRPAKKSPSRSNELR